MVISYRPIKQSFSRNERQNAKRKVAAYVFRARATALQRGQRTWFVRSGNIMKVLVDSSGVKVRVGQQVDLKTQHDVTFTSSPLDTVEFDPRGFATNIATSERYLLARGGAVDTVSNIDLDDASTVLGNSGIYYSSCALQTIFQANAKVMPAKHRAYTTMF